MFALLKSSKKTPDVIQMKKCDLEIMSSIQQLNPTTKVTSASNKYWSLVSRLIQHQNYIKQVLI